MKFDTAQPGISVLIPTWNGADLLRQYLPYLQTSLAQYAGPWECLVVDDGSSDNTLELLAKEFPWVVPVAAKRNRGFSHAFNLGLKTARYPLILSLNNDVKVSPGFLGPLVEVFRQEEDVFGVAALQEGKSAYGDPVKEGCPDILWKQGSLQIIQKTEEALKTGGEEPGYLNFACCLLDREKLQALGGLNEVFSPFYWEDIELGIRARLAGWKLRFCAASVVEHCHSTTTRKKRLMFRLIPVRNLYLIHWLLLDDPDIRSEYRRQSCKRMLRELTQVKLGLLVGWLLAVVKLPAVSRSRRRYEATRKLKLRDILDISL